MSEIRCQYRERVRDIIREFFNKYQIAVITDVYLDELVDALFEEFGSYE